VKKEHHAYDLNTGMLFFVVIHAISAWVTKNKSQKKQRNEFERANQNGRSFQTACSMLAIDNLSENLQKFFLENNCKTIAIYGMGRLGDIIFHKLSHSQIHIMYGIDKKAKSIAYEIPVYSIEDNLEEVDMVIVTVTYSFREIKRSLQKKVSCPIASLDEVLFEIGGSLHENKDNKVNELLKG
jgi:hypothetical protein